MPYTAFYVLHPGRNQLQLLGTSSFDSVQLESYYIKDSPVIAGVPIDPIVVLDIEECYMLPEHTNVVRGFPIAVKGSYTHHEFLHKKSVTRWSKGQTYRSLTIYVKNKNGKDAQYSELGVWLTFL